MRSYEEFPRPAPGAEGGAPPPSATPPPGAGGPPASWPGGLDAATLPTWLAHPWAALCAEEHPRVRLAWLTDTADLVVRWTVAVALAEVVHAQGAGCRRPWPTRSPSTSSVRRSAAGSGCSGRSGPRRLRARCSRSVGARVPRGRRRVPRLRRRPRAPLHGAQPAGHAPHPRRAPPRDRPAWARRRGRRPDGVTTRDRGRSRARGAEKARFRAPAAG